MGTELQPVSSRLIRQLAAEVGFRPAGVAGAEAAPDFPRFRDWMERGLAGEMRYLTDRRADLRADLESPAARREIRDRGRDALWRPGQARIARYARGEDYHAVMRRGLEALAARLSAYAEFEWRACVDTAPLLERSLARQAGLGWIGHNTCLISQEIGLVLPPRRTVDNTGDTARFPPSRPLRHLHPLHRRLPHPGDRPVPARAVSNSMPGAAFRTSRLSCAAPFRKNFAPGWARTSSAAISARMFAPGIAARPKRKRTTRSPGRWRNWRP